MLKKYLDLEMDYSLKEDDARAIRQRLIDSEGTTPQGYMSAWKRIRNLEAQMAWKRADMINLVSQEVKGLRKLEKALVLFFMTARGIAPKRDIRIRIEGAKKLSTKKRNVKYRVHKHEKDTVKPKRRVGRPRKDGK